MTGGDLTIDDGEYCDRCPLADALDCMSVDDCPRRELARAIAGLPPTKGITMPDDTESKVLVGLGTPLDPGGPPIVILGMTPSSFELIRLGQTHTFDLRKAGVPVQIVIFSGESHAEIAAMMEAGVVAQGGTFGDQRGKDGALPNLGIDDPTTH